ncbi:hypothetical protein EW146_g4138 [Bondarzewia mesenterica]|uniref:AB hydrolase-1 domain-containing protein n=1 Tax=Bondarzewia mesenterica TaxID=1095465 RepID=A0A4S4LXL8_9AGAM|nr:hypothetical protein EW146_g4138 [Bondarzewia mesenterica]
MPLFPGPIPGSDSKLLRSSDGCEIYAEATGDPRCPHVVLIHGLTFSGTVFDALCRAVLDKLYIVRYDLRGHGRSGKPETPEAHASKLYADDFMAVVEGFGLKKPVLAGWSFGGTIVIDLATYIAPLPISGVFYINSTSITKKSGMPLMATILGLDAHLATSARALQEMRAACFLPDAPPRPYAARRAALGRVRDARAYLAALEAGAVNVFVYYGARDALLDGTVLADEMKAGARNVEVEAVRDGCHAVFAQFPEETGRALVRLTSAPFWEFGAVKNIDFIPQGRHEAQAYT